MDYEVMTSFMSPWDPDYVEEAYEEKVEDGTIWMKCGETWYPIAEASTLPAYDLAQIMDHWYPAPDSAQDYFPFYNLTDFQLKQIFGYEPSDEDIYEVFNEPPQGLNPNAKEFYPKGLNPNAEEFYPQALNVFYDPDADDTYPLDPLDYHDDDADDPYDLDLAFY
jgi:hypothetical protein